eukprot:768529-Hanusia_phi.AAC.3
MCWNPTYPPSSPPSPHSSPTCHQPLALSSLSSTPDPPNILPIVQLSLLRVNVTCCRLKEVDRGSEEPGQRVSNPLPSLGKPLNGQEPCAQLNALRDSDGRMRPLFCLPSPAREAQVDLSYPVHPHDLRYDLGKEIEVKRVQPGLPLTSSSSW